MFHITITGADKTLQKALVIPATYEGYTVTDIKYGAFMHTKFTSITVPGNIHMEQSVFSPSGQLQSIYFSENVTFLGGYQLAICSKLTDVTLPTTLTVLPLYMFYGCRSLPSIDIPDKVTTLRKHAFDGCTALKTVHLPLSVTQIEEACFLSVPGETLHIYYAGSESDRAKINIDESGNTALSQATWHYNCK